MCEPPLEQLSDEQLMAVQGEERGEALSILCPRWQDRLFRFVWLVVRNIHDAEDLIQEVWVALLTKGATYDPARPFKPWLYKIAHNKAVNHLRRKGILFAYPSDEESDGIEDDSADPLKGLIRQETADRVRQVLMKLPTEYRTVIILADIEGFKNKDLACIIGRNDKATESLLHRARMKFRELLDSYLNPETPEVNS